MNPDQGNRTRPVAGDREEEATHGALEALAQLLRVAKSTATLLEVNDSVSKAELLDNIVLAELNLMRIMLGETREGS